MSNQSKEDLLSVYSDAYCKNIKCMATHTFTLKVTSALAPEKWDNLNQIMENICGSSFLYSIDDSVFNADLNINGSIGGGAWGGIQALQCDCVSWATLGPRAMRWSLWQQARSLYTSLRKVKLTSRRWSNLTERLLSSPESAGCGPFSI